MILVDDTTTLVDVDGYARFRYRHDCRNRTGEKPKDA